MLLQLEGSGNIPSELFPSLTAQYIGGIVLKVRETGQTSVATATNDWSGDKGSHKISKHAREHTTLEGLTNESHPQTCAVYKCCYTQRG